MDDVFERFMDSAGVPENDRPDVRLVLKRLRTRYPNETPARLFDRARKEGAPIPVARCLHRVQRGACVACDPRLGVRTYFTAAGDLVHTTPTCPALAAGSREPIEVGAGEGREACPECAKPRAAPRRASSAARSVSRPVTRPRAVIPSIGPAELSPSSPPDVGDRIDWGGFSGVVTGVSGRGVTLSVDGVTLTAPWGERATVRRPRGG